MSKIEKDIIKEYNVFIHNKELICEMAQKNKRIERLKTALNFYADNDNYKLNNPDMQLNGGFSFLDHKIQKDKGQRAREALREDEQKELEDLKPSLDSDGIIDSKIIEPFSKESFDLDGVKLTTQNKEDLDLIIKEFNLKKNNEI